jgi:hypothetical protein
MYIMLTIFIKKYGVLVLHENQGEAEMLHYNQMGFAVWTFILKKGMKSVVIEHFKLFSQYLDGRDGEKLW